MSTWSRVADADRLEWLAKEFEKNGCLSFNHYGRSGCLAFTISSQHVRAANFRAAIDAARSVRAKDLEALAKEPSDG